MGSKELKHFKTWNWNKGNKENNKRGILEMENPFKQMGTTDAHIVNQIEGMEGRISAVESAENKYIHW